ncbi:hypothetical protein Ciccas_011312 [Cichlidogyrus casuarinus]|uniref:SCP domain-containing protein n=1 Tax=Cichlidogyrus casuarinus TaxID=1844966 RepID=A0ABD2PRL8_9PLAT
MLIRHFFLVSLLLLVKARTGNSNTIADEYKLLFLRLHNELREKVRKGELAGEPAAALMPDLQWDDDLADKAYLLAAQCRVGHDTNTDRRTANFPNVGQNWAGNPSPQEGFAAWFNEYKSYDFANNQCNSICGHYTQLVWADSTHVGCAVADCSNYPSFPYGYSIVCNYGPAGNVLGEKPYFEHGAATNADPNGHSSPIYIGAQQQNSKQPCICPTNMAQSLINQYPQQYGGYNYRPTYSSPWGY